MTIAGPSALGQQSWPFHPASGLPKHGPSLDKPQSKVWFALGSWWALIARPDRFIGPELAIFELTDEMGWRDCGTVVVTDGRSTADACYDGSSLWVATRAPGAGVALHRFWPNSGGDHWVRDAAEPWRAPDVECPSVSVARGLDDSIWVHFTEDHLPWYASASIEQYPRLGLPRPVPGASATLLDVDLGALVPMESGMGLLWSDQGSDSFYFAIVSPEGQWRTEVAATGDLVADDHVAIRSLDGRLYVAVKTSKDTVEDPVPDDPLILLLVREPDGEWHQHPVVNVTEPVTRPIPLLEPEAGRLHVLYTFGPNPGERAIHIKSASLDELKFEVGRGEPVLSAPGAEINDVTSSREPLTAERGAVLLASDGANLRYYSCRLVASSPTGSKIGAQFT